uniref:Uncharacterized protein n=1 Tax=Trypanosoma vivax (strain Y486) TaxID=1055687 RepID=G0U8G6_TRYVY|nr:hypothetical protein TVY486_1113760 [Trypanosoma vivax Y486]
MRRMCLQNCSLLKCLCCAYGSRLLCAQESILIMCFTPTFMCPLPPKNTFRHRHCRFQYERMPKQTMRAAMWYIYMCVCVCVCVCVLYCLPIHVVLPDTAVSAAVRSVSLCVIYCDLVGFTCGSALPLLKMPCFRFQPCITLVGHAFMYTLPVGSHHTWQTDR